MGKLVRTKSKGFGQNTAKNHYRPRAKNSKKLSRKLYRYYVKYSVFIGILMYIALAQISDTATMLLPYHIVGGGLIFWGWKHNTNQWAYSAKSTIGKAWFVTVFVLCHFTIAGNLVESPPTAYLLGFIIMWIFRFTGGNSNTVPADRYISGAKKVDAAWYYNKHQNIVDTKVATGAHPAEFVNFMGLLLTTTEATLNFLLFGEVRSGKSLAISMMLNVLQYPNKRALLYDYANNYYAKLLAMGIDPSRIIMLTPFHTDCFEWLLSKDLTSPPITRVFFEQLIQSNDPKDKFFVAGSINIACDVVETLNRTAREAGKEAVWGMKELCEFCTDEERLIELLQTYPDIWRRNKALAGGSEQQQGYMGTLANVFTQLKSPSECWYRARLLGRTVSFRDFPTSDHIVLLGRDEQLGGQALDFFNSAVIAFCIDTVIGKTTSDTTKPAETFIVADEFQTFGKLKKMRMVTTEGGKYGFCAILATQSFQLIEEIYGKGETAAMLGNITHLAVFQVNDNFTTKYLSEFFAETTVLEASLGIKDEENKNGITVMRKSITWTEKTKPLFTPAHFKSQSKIDPQNPKDGLMGVTIRCDGYNYTLKYHWHDILTMLPPKPTEEQERLNTAPQDESLFYPTSLTDQQLVDLGLEHMVDADAVEDMPNYGAYEAFKEVDFDALDLEEE